MTSDLHLPTYYLTKNLTLHRQVSKNFTFIIKSKCIRIFDLLQISHLYVLFIHDFQISNTLSNNYIYELLESALLLHIAGSMNLKNLLLRMVEIDHASQNLGYLGFKSKNYFALKYCSIFFKDSSNPRLIVFHSN